MKSLVALSVACVLTLTALQARAAIGVGDSVTSVQYKSTEGGEVNIAAMKGKLVLIDFWATWCGPCMREAPHMVSINEKYGTKGLILLGISLDQDAGAMTTGAKAAKLTWPQVIDGGKFSAMFGVNSIPRTFLVGPDGKVLWTGHPAGGLDGAIEDAFKNHPPFLVDPAIIADASKVLDQVEEHLTHKDARGAMKLLAKVSADAKKDGKFAARSADVQKKLEAAADSLVIEAESLASAGSYPEAFKSLRDISDSLPGLPAAAKAKKDLADLLVKPEAKAALAKADKEAKEADRNARAMEVLAMALRLQADKKDDQAYAKLKTVIKDWAGTEAAMTAAAEIKKYDTLRPDLARAASDSVVSAKARAALSMAKNYVESGRNDLAKSKYQSIIKSFPHTEYAETAKRALRDLGE